VSSWTILTGEYPPDCGGVADYTSQVARALAAAGEDVMVVCPPSRFGRSDSAVRLVTLPDRFGAESRSELDRLLDTRPGTRVLVQYVPNAFGFRGANLAWCRSLKRRVDRDGTDVRVMFHEPYFYFGWNRPQRNALALVQRAMAALLLRTASRVYLSTDAWRAYLRPYASPSTPPFLTLPIPSAIPRCEHPAAGRALRKRLGIDRGRVIGHFGTYGAHVAPLVRRTLTTLLKEDRAASAICVGAGSDLFVRDLARAHPRLAGRIHPTSRLAPADVALHLTACDLLFQPYPDGVTTRRTSVMAGLANGCPILTTSGPLTEPIWSATSAVAMVSAVDANELHLAARELLADPARLAAIAARGDLAYRSHFALEHTIAVLLDRRGAAAA
jgi:glycosyltransferase involved in cell wall biosynthesis